MLNHFAKRLLLLSLTAGLICTAALPACAAVVSTSEQAYRNQVFRVCGISDAENQEQPATRAEFARMLVFSSAEKDTIGTISAAAAPDVPGSHAYAAYIRIALRNNWMRNRLSGNFEPDAVLTLSEAARAVMTMLGYSDSDFSGNVSEARLAKFSALGLNDGVSVSGAFDPLKRRDAVNVLYNALRTNPKQSNNILGSAINLTLSADGSLNATSVLDNTIKGPILIRKYSDIQANLPFPMEEGQFYYNGTQRSYYLNQQLFSYTSQLDSCGWLILYYNEASRTVWGYGADTGGNAYHCVRGIVGGIYYDSDNIAAPTAIVINDTAYTLGSAEAKFMFSVNGTISVGDEVILICKDNDLEYEEGMTDYYVTGVILYRKKEK